MTFPTYPRTERQKRLVALAGELADTFARRANEGEWAGHFPYENYRDLHKSGYLALTVPRDFGGEGADVLDTLLAQARLAQGCASTALVAAMHLSTIGRIAASTHEPNPLFERICSSVALTTSSCSPSMMRLRPEPTIPADSPFSMRSTVERQPLWDMPLLQRT